jgi:hypothetical protein
VARVAVTDPLPDDVRSLLERHFTSVSELEALLVLIRDCRPWTVKELARALVINEDHAESLMAALIKMRLVASVGPAYIFDPHKKADRAAAEALSALYDKYRLRIMNVIFSKPSEPLREFGEAFRLRPRSPDEGEG